MSPQNPRSETTGLRISLALAAALSAGVARAEVIEFENDPGPTVNDLILSYTEGGFTFSSEHMHFVDSPETCSTGCSTNGTRFLNEERTDPFIRMTGDAPFRLHSFDAAEVFIGELSRLPNADLVEVTGEYAGGGVVTVSFDLDGVRDGLGGAPDFQTFVLPNSFAGLAAVNFVGRVDTGGGAGLALDNVVVNRVPEPATGLGAAILAVGVFCRPATSRRRYQAASDLSTQP